MTDIELLKQMIVDSGMTKTAIARKAGITRDRLYTILDGVDVKATEIEGLAKTLRMTNPVRDRVFFAKDVAQETTV
jgi:predicted transcriptional regulator